MKFTEMKFDVQGRPELAIAVQERLFELGCGWYSGVINQTRTISDLSWLFVNTDGRMTCSRSHSYGNHDKGRPLRTLQDLYDMPPATYDLSIDGVHKEIPHKQYQQIMKILEAPK